MANKTKRYDEKRTQQKNAQKGQAVPGTGHDTKKIQQKGP